MTNLILNTQNATAYNNPSTSIFSTTIVQTMSSREISDLTHKRHTDVKRDIEVMSEQLSLDVSKFAHIYFDSMNRQQTEYALDKDLSICLVSGYSVQLRMAIIKRWAELEQQILLMNRPSYMIEDPVARAQKWIEEETAKQEAQLKLADAAKVIEIQTPKVEVFDAVLDSKRTYSLREFAQRTGVKEKEVKKWIIDKRWATGTNSKNFKPAAWSNVHNYMRMIRKGKPFTTPYGTTCYNEVIAFTQEGFNEAVRKMVKSGMMKPLAIEVVEVDNYALQA